MTALAPKADLATLFATDIEEPDFAAERGHDLALARLDVARPGYHPSAHCRP